MWGPRGSCANLAATSDKTRFKTTEGPPVTVGNEYAAASGSVADKYSVTRALALAGSPQALRRWAVACGHSRCKSK
uniref:Uncharacterized protein n=1 Tax=Oryza rufipogon TaxID=4529 RepID=A0A0E0PAP8_ORYRU